ncbi:HAD family hydrolase [Patescibacteria group bacterium]|nr:HAD family hydrolase [Patescibacteria group bacterium]MBU1016233.1 HAD family hydrolase [Patescibacteria group bacterium]
MPNRIDTVVWDADNTLWDWIKMHLEGMRAMSHKISHITGASLADVRSSMARVYGQAGTFDYKPLAQEMDIVEEWATGIQPEREKIRRIIDLGFAVHTAYTQSRHDTFAMYPGTVEVLDKLNETGVSNIILSDAPISKIVRRVKHFGIERYFRSIYGRSDAMVDGEKQRGKENLDNYEKTRREAGIYTTNIPTEILSDQIKPDVDLSELLEKSPDEIADTVAVIGDNFDKDIGTAHNNECHGFFARYGAADVDSVSGLYEFAPPSVVTRNATGVDLSQENLAVIHKMGNKLKIIDDVREVLKFVLGHNGHK